MSTIAPVFALVRSFVLFFLHVLENEVLILSLGQLASLVPQEDHPEGPTEMERGRTF